MIPLNILFLCDFPEYSQTANALFDHINALTKASEHNVIVLNNIGDFSEAIPLEKFDVLVIHFSIFVPFKTFYTRLRAFTQIAVKGNKN